jgi:cytochrome c biogenesis protein CcmG, thiol:disulfide interchange protein DsbE
MKKRILPLAVIVFSTTLLLQTRGSSPSAEQDCPSCSSFGIQRLEKMSAPSFSLKGLNGNKVTLKSLKGKPIILTFWATWCSPCKEELPTLEKFGEGKKDQLTILTIAMDGDEKKVRRFIEENKMNLVVVLDVSEQTARTYRVRMIPTTFLINREGMIIGTIVGQRDWSVQEAWSAVKQLFDLH